MAFGRYQVRSGIVINSRRLAEGGRLVTVYGPEGKTNAIARPARKVSGARLELFSQVELQLYRRRAGDLASVTQGVALEQHPRLAEPARYALGNLLCELIDHLAQEEDPHPATYRVFQSGLKGVERHSDPEKVALITVVKLLGEAGLAPRLGRCVSCGQIPVVGFSAAAGGATCASCPGEPYSPRALVELAALQRATFRRGLELPLARRPELWSMLAAHLDYHVARLHSLGWVRETLEPPAGRAS
ncbi:MAG: DNA repair protein RecO [Deinococcus sp.]|nr:DNA repair protein RecO [Deinococcus sp.]